MIELDPRDRLLQELTPALMVPRHGDFTPWPLERPGHSGHRYLLAETGLFLEVTRPWLHVIWPVTEDDLLLPYGDLEGFSGVRMRFEWEELDPLLDRFVEFARAALPNEAAGWITWRADGDAHRLDWRPLIAAQASPGSHTANLPRLDDGEHMVIDLHSHGEGRTFFSPQDDKDDFGEVKYAGVVGHLDRTPAWRFRLSLPGGFFVDDDRWVNH